MKFAIIETGGKQYKVSEGAILDVEKLSKANPKLGEGDKVVFDKVLLTSDGRGTKVGTPYVDGVKVEATLVSEKKGRKVVGLRYKNKTRQSTTPYGHRQVKARVKVGKI